MISECVLIYVKWKNANRSIDCIDLGVLQYVACIDQQEEIHSDRASYRREMIFYCLHKGTDQVLIAYIIIVIESSKPRIHKRERENGDRERRIKSLCLFIY